MLSVMAVIRVNEDRDNIENILSLALVDTANGAATNRSIQSFDPLASSSWEDVPPTRTVITPVLCKSLWRQFNAETEYTVTQAIAAQEANRRNYNWLPPPWAIAALLILGFSEFMTLLRNPLYLGVLFVAFLLGKALWVQLDIIGEFRNGALPDLLSLSTKFVPTVLSLLKKLAEQGQQPAAPADQRATDLDSSFQNGLHSSSLSSDASSSMTTSDSGVEHTSALKQRSDHYFHAIMERILSWHYTSCWLAERQCTGAMEALTSEQRLRLTSKDVSSQKTSQQVA